MPKVSYTQAQVDKEIRELAINELEQSTKSLLNHHLEDDYLLLGIMNGTLKVGVDYIIDYEVNKRDCSLTYTVIELGKAPTHRYIEHTMVEFVKGYATNYAICIELKTGKKKKLTNTFFDELKRNGLVTY